jgi:hypothetical protein
MPCSPAAGGGDGDPTATTANSVMMAAAIQRRDWSLIARSPLLLETEA